jgi:hypothetical protein
MLNTKDRSRVARDGAQLPQRTTLLMLVQALATTCASDSELIATARELVRTSRVALTGNFARSPGSLLVD